MTDLIDNSGMIAQREASASEKLIILGYIAAIGGTELTGARVDPLLGVLADALLVPILLSHFAFAPRTNHRRIYPVLALLPLLRILSYTMPIKQVPQLYWYALVGLPLLVGAGLTAR